MEMKMDITGMDVIVHSDLYKAGITEDGEDYTAECYYIILEHLDGRRWAHFKTFKGCQVHRDHESGCMFFEDIRKSAQYQCEQVAGLVRRKKTVDLEYWSEIAPVYGSIAYQIQEGIIDQNGQYL